MNYPISGLAIIAPILFIVLLISFPVIGVFGGWKRAAYWAGGNFIFYIIGLIVWKTAGGNISSSLTGLFSDLLKDMSLTETQITNVVHSVAAPIFFIGVMLITNILLVINYYAWFKRVSKIKQESQVKKVLKLFKKNGVQNETELLKSLLPFKDHQDIQKEIQTKTGKLINIGKYKTLINLNPTELKIRSKKYNIINMVASGVGMTALMLPITMSLTSTTYYLTTSNATRKTNSLSAGLYSGLEGVNSGMSWFSYYGNKEGSDFDALFSALGLMNKDITVTYYDADGNEQTASGTPIEIATKVIPEGIQTVINEIENCIGSSPTGESQATYQDVVNSTSNFANTWNQIVDQCGAELTGVLSSDNAVEIFSQLIGENQGTGMSITPDMIDNINSQIDVYNQIMDKYDEVQERQSTQSEVVPEIIEITVNEQTIILENVITVKQIEVPESVANTMKETLNNLVDSSQLTTEEQKNTYNNLINTLTNMIFKY